MLCFILFYIRMIKTVTVYAASSSQLDKKYFDAAEELGKLLAVKNITCINGGGNNGLMCAVTDAVLKYGGKVIGIIPQFMVDEGWIHNCLTEIRITQDMHERKQLMAQEADACIALPGGIGTMEELLEIMTWKQLGLYNKPIMILNTGGYYDELLFMLGKAGSEKFMHDSHLKMWEVGLTPQDVVDKLFIQKQWHDDPRSIAAL